MDDFDVDFSDNTSNEIVLDDKKNIESIENKIKKPTKQISYYEFLKKYQKYEREDECTHTSITGGKYLIPKEEEDLFIKLYANKIANIKNEPLGMLEKPTSNYGPIKIDIDLKYKILKTSLLTNKIINILVTSITKIIQESIEGNYMCIVTKRKETYKDKNGYIKDGIHIFYPYIVTNYKYQHALRKLYLKTMEDDLKELKYDRKLNPIESIYDEAVVERNNYFLYLSTKPKTKPYVIIGIYNTDEKTISNIKDMDSLELVKLMSIRNKSNINPTKGNYNKMINMKNNYNTKIVSSKKQDNKNNLINDKVIVNLDNRQDNKNDVIINDQLIENSNDEQLNSDNKQVSPDNRQVQSNNNEDNKLIFEINDIEKIVNMFSTNRCNNYDDWLNIGICLYNINKNYMLIWENWSSKDIEKYEKGSCEKKWRTFKKDKKGLTIKSLLSWAKIDNPTEYNEFIQNKKKQSMILSKYPNDNIIMGETKKVGDAAIYTKILNTKCFIKGEAHNDMNESMYIEMIDKFMTIKCRHHECFGMTYYPNGHISMTKNEMNIFYGNVTININNNKDEILEFNELKIYDNNEKLNKLIIKCLNGGSKHGNCADILFYDYKDKYNYGEDDNWYKFDNSKWKNIGKKNMELRRKIKKDMVKLYQKILNIHKKEDDEKKWNYIYNSTKLFEDTQFKNNIMTELIETYTTKKNSNRDFVKKLDKNRKIIGFENGLYDLVNLTFRKTEPTDYISMTTGYDYSENYTEHKEELMRFLEDILPDKLERDYMLTYLSSGLTGNTLELFTVLTNSGRNGKSKLIELLGHTFGDYFASIKSQIFTRPCPDANSPDPGLLNLLNKRIVVASEPAKGEKLNVGFIKFITGRDSATLRNCHSNEMIEFTGNFLTLLVCNNIPDCDDIDAAFSKRLRCINFPNHFTENPTKPNEKKLISNINENFEKWKYDMMKLLIDYYKIYVKDRSLVPTEKILKWTNMYKENTDIYLQFINEHTRTSEKNEDRIHCSELYRIFKDWFKNNNPNTKVPNNKIFIDGLRKHKIVDKIKIEGIVQLGITNILSLENE